MKSTVKSALLTVILCLVTTEVNASNNDEGLLETLKLLGVSYPETGAVSIAPAERWDDGSIVGNGVQGALAYCRTVNEEIVFSHEEMFVPMYPFYGYLPVLEHYDTIQQLVLNGKADEAQQLLKDLKIQLNIPRYNTTDPFVGAGSLHLRMRSSQPKDAYIRSTDFATGEALVAWQEASGIFHRSFFFSRADDVFVLRLTSPTGSKLNLTLELGEIELIPHPHPKAPPIYERTIDHCSRSVSGNVLTQRIHFKDRYEGQPLHGSTTICRVITKGGNREANDTDLQITGADEVLLLVRTIPDRRSERLNMENEIAKLFALVTDYDRMLRKHAAIHGEIFNRCRLTLSPPDEQRVSSEALQAGSSVGNTSPALAEKAFAAARYGIISSTGRRPPLLQGVWTGTWKPRWSGDYTLNGNVQSMVAASLCGNHYECQESLMNYLDSLMTDFRNNARELLGFRGALIPWRASTNGLTHYLSCYDFYHDFPGIYWFAGTGWFVQIYYEYYLYTQDETFFQERFKPFLFDAIALYEDYLSLEDENGTFILSPSSSPENQTAPNIWMAPNATMTIAVIKETLRTGLRHSEQLGATEVQVARWHQMIDKLPDYQIDKYGALKEWTWPGIENEEGHRHASHLYPLYFGVAPEIAQSKTLQEAGRIAIERRLAPRRKEQGGGMAFGLVQLGMSAAHLGEVSLAYETIEYLLNSYWSPAMVSLHDVEEIFNLDISGGLPALMITMLTQTPIREQIDEPWEIRLLPCLPAAWPNGSLKGAHSRGGFELDIAWSSGQLQEVTITSLRGEPARVAYGEQLVDLKLRKGESVTLDAKSFDQRHVLRAPSKRD